MKRRILAETELSLLPPDGSSCQLGAKTLCKQAPGKIFTEFCCRLLVLTVSKRASFLSNDRAAYWLFGKITLSNFRDTRCMCREISSSGLYLNEYWARIDADFLG